MKNVPHWHWLVVLYFILVAVPVYYIHLKLRGRAYAHRTFINLLFYFVGVIGAAYLMHSFSMWLYFTFFFGVRN